MSKERDMADFQKLLHELEQKGRKYGEGDALTESLGGEKFSYATRRVVSEMVNIIEDNPEFAGMVPEKLREFFEGYKMQWPRHASGGDMDKIAIAIELMKVAKSLTARHSLSLQRLGPDEGVIIGKMELRPLFRRSEFDDTVERTRNMVLIAFKTLQGENRENNLTWDDGGEVTYDGQWVEWKVRVRGKPGQVINALGK